MYVFHYNDDLTMLTPRRVPAHGTLTGMSLANLRKAASLFRLDR